MSNILVSKKYVKAIVSSNDGDKLSYMVTTLKDILPAFKSEKFSGIIDSQFVSTAQKVDFIISFLNNPSNEVINLIKLLGEKKRLQLLPEIVSIIEDELAIKNNNYSGLVFSNMDLSNDYLNNLSSSLSNKFNKNIILSFIKSDYEGVKVDIEGLGVEIGFSKDRFKKSIAEHILKAV